MGYLILTAECLCCKTLFTCNPELVPSLMWQGRKEPICRDCIEKANPIRIANGLEPAPILPGAYEPMEVD